MPRQSGCRASPEKETRTFHLFYRPKDEETTVNLQLIDTQLDAFVDDTRIERSLARELCLQLDSVSFPFLYLPEHSPSDVRRPFYRLDLYTAAQQTTWLEAGVRDITTSLDILKALKGVTVAPRQT